jgi:hypothetical protein
VEAVVAMPLLVRGTVVREAWRALDFAEFDEPGPQTESAVERGFRPHGSMDDEWGRSESFDPENLGDIADEGPGHRG